EIIGSYARHLRRNIRAPHVAEHDFAFLLEDREETRPVLLLRVDVSKGADRILVLRIETLDDASVNRHRLVDTSEVVLEHLRESIAEIDLFALALSCCDAL